MNDQSKQDVQIHKQEILYEETTCWSPLLPERPLLAQICLQVYLVILEAPWGQGSPGDTGPCPRKAGHRVWDGCPDGWGQKEGGTTALSSACTQPYAPGHRHASCKQQTRPIFPCKRQRAGEIQDTAEQRRGTYSCSREASPLNACLSIDWISFLYR